MEATNEIIYRNSDQYYAIIGVSLKQVNGYTYDLTSEKQNSFDALKVFAQSKIDTPLKTLGYRAEPNMLVIYSEERKIVTLTVSELSLEDKALVDAVGIICTELLNL